MNYLLKNVLSLILLTCLTVNISQAQDTESTDYDVEVTSQNQSVYLRINGTARPESINLNGEELPIVWNGNATKIETEVDFKGKLLFIEAPGAPLKLVHVAKLKNESIRVRNIPLWLSIIPPLIAIILALIFKEVIISLFAGIWAGAFIAGGMRIGSVYYLFLSFLETVQKYIIDALNDSGHLSVIIFSLLIGGMVALISKNGGMAGVVRSLSRYAKSDTSSQFITWLLGVAIFFDDYANTLIVGNTMRSVTDKFNVSREKLAYIVDSTAAPVAAIAFITTWIGAELGYIADGIQNIDLGVDMTAYAIFLSSLKYSYYPILTLIFILILIYQKKDFGPMHKAEVRARTTGRVSGAMTEDEDEPDMEDLTPVKNSPLKWQYAFFPVITVILMTIYGLVDTGFQNLYADVFPNGGPHSYGAIWNNMHELFAGDSPGFITKLGTLIGASDSYIALLWASLSGVVVALAMTIFGKVMKLFDAMHWMVTGFKTMVPALLILTLAWALAITTEELHTADFLSNLLSGNINPFLLPVFIFVLAALIAFSTGSSWSTMAILYPIGIPTTFAVCSAVGLPQDVTLEVMFSVISTILSASVLGDHCSPISDTTILSSLASDCNHIDHVKTQLPYALTVGLVSIICVFISTYVGGVFIVNLLLFATAIVVLYLIVWKLGKPIPSK